MRPFVSWSRVLGFTLALELSLGVCLPSSGAFQPPIVVHTGGESYSVAAADLNRDGHLDLVTCDPILLGNGHGRFTVAGGLGLVPSCLLVVGDFNGDGKPDVAAVDAQVKIFLGDGRSAFFLAPGSPFSTGVAANWAA